MFRHLVTLGIEHETRRDHVLEGHRVEDHCSNGVQGKEPATGLIHTLVDKVAREGNTLIDQVFILKWIMYLRIRHRARIEPYIDKIGLALHRLATL